MRNHGEQSSWQRVPNYGTTRHMNNELTAEEWAALTEQERRDLWNEHMDAYEAEGGEVES